MALIQYGYARRPGIHELLETIEMDPTWGRWDINRTWIQGVTLSNVARDRYDSGSGVAEQTILRPGLLMEYIGTGAEAGKWRQWIDDASTKIGGVLIYSETTQVVGGGHDDKWFGYILCGGQIRTKGIIVYGRAAAAPQSGTNYKNLVGYDESGQAPAGTTETAIREYLQEKRSFLLDDYTTAIQTAT